MVTRAGNTVIGGKWSEYFQYNPNTTSGLTFGYIGGVITNNAGYGIVPNGTVALADGSSNDIYIDVENFEITTDLGTGDNRVIIYTVVTSGGSISSITDKRTRSNTIAFEAPPIFSAFALAMADQDPDHWWRCSDLIPYSTAGQTVTDFGSSLTLVDGYHVSSIADQPVLRQGNASNAEYCYKLDNTGYIEWGNGNTDPLSDIYAASTGTFSILCRPDQEGPIESSGFDRVIWRQDDVSNIDRSDVWEVGLTTHTDVNAEQLDVLGGYDALYLEITSGGTGNFRRWEMSTDNLKVGKDWLYIVIKQDGTGPRFFVNNVEYTDDMTETSGGTGVGVDAWWDTPLNSDIWRAGEAINSTTYGMEGFYSHIALSTRVIDDFEINDAWETIEPSVTLATWPAVWIPNINYTHEYHKLMRKVQPTQWLPMNETSGRIIYNHGVSGTWQNGLLIGQAGCSLNVFGPTGLERAIAFNHGTTQFAGIRTNGQVSNTINRAGNDCGGYMGWFYVDETSIGTVNTIYNGTNNLNTSSDHVNIWIDSSGKLNCLYYDFSSSTQQTNIVSTNAMSPETWHFFVWDASDASGWRLWIDGVEDTTYTYATASTSESYWREILNTDLTLVTLGTSLTNKQTGAATVDATYQGSDNLRLAQFAMFRGQYGDTSYTPAEASRMGDGSIVAELYSIGSGS